MLKIIWTWAVKALSDARAKDFASRIPPFSVLNRKLNTLHTLSLVDPRLRATLLLTEGLPPLQAIREHVPSGASKNNPKIEEMLLLCTAPCELLNRMQVVLC